MVFHKGASAAAVLASLLLVSCEDADTDEQLVAEEEALTPVEWGYEGAGGPENWGRLNAEFAQCESGTNQSPVNLSGGEISELPDPQFNYASQLTEIENLGHTLQVEVAPGSTMNVAGREYELAQFHFHTPSEHHLRGAEFPAELHLVHRGPENQLAVVGVFIEEGEARAQLSQIWNQLPAQPGESEQIDIADFSAETLLPEERQHYLYPGSLTTPPCSEGVNWMVMDQPIAMSAEQISELRAIIGTSDRPVQPLGDRELRLDSQ
ncbi:carbonic anhydrase family protein [Altererythrobacter sp. SALINAS58]|uniref:carbonic anhydrase n=1 Tax=Alteripontixanthobacter muriae TaxID=2705546 RepID=UPI0015756F31|nr:carbonic anhydrase family protein [Alteripontixanthobacter muriae]NTZ42115.1 carbonic anhydrase family protein [Alteripontixanthobacter muriae]